MRERSSNPGRMASARVATSRRARSLTRGRCNSFTISPYIFARLRRSNFSRASSGSRSRASRSFSSRRRWNRDFRGSSRFGSIAPRRPPWYLSPYLTRLGFRSAPTELDERMAGSSTTRSRSPPPPRTRLASRNRSNRASSGCISIARLRSYAAWTCPTTPATGTPPFRAARLAAKTSRRSCSSTSSTFSLYARSMRRYRGCSRGRAPRAAPCSRNPRARAARAAPASCSPCASREVPPPAPSAPPSPPPVPAAAPQSPRVRVSKSRNDDAPPPTRAPRVRDALCANEARRSSREAPTQSRRRDANARPNPNRSRRATFRENDAREVCTRRRDAPLENDARVVGTRTTSSPRSPVSSTVSNEDDASRSRYKSRPRLKSSAFAFDDV